MIEIFFVWRKENLQINQELIDLQTNTPNIEKETETLVQFNKELGITEKNCGKISETLDEYMIVHNLLKDSGIKSQIIKRYVPIFNNLINKYLNSMDFFVNFTLDENFNECLRVDLEMSFLILLSLKERNKRLI